ncbi:IS1595 family transposase, partial [Escherichia coli]|uniref:IS1595 family transposase n=9 Tax=Escherichia coli TaxID=562 RepID=UPI002378FDBD|nr:IS1595 family transposase [Escherichia coli]MDD8281647.1 IS1595 family transposase [Escherichia coli]MDD8391706.1 IS1595 family transposase [Escherichia coli]
MRKSRLSQYKQERLLELFIAGSTARIAAELVGVHRNTAAYYFHRLRVLIAEHVDKHSWFDGEIELDESYFGGRRKGLRGRGAAGKVPVFGLLKRGGKVYTKVIPDAKSRTLLPIIESKIYPDSIVYTDNFASYDVLDVSDFKGTVAKLAMRQPFVLFKGLTFQKLCLPGAFRPGDHHNKMLRPG